MSIYVKTPDRWEPLVGGSLDGAPGEPYLPDPRGGSVVVFIPGTEGSAGPTIAYGAYITPSGDGATVEVDQETLEATVSGTEPFVDYVVSIYGVNAAGKGEPVSTFPFQLNYNSATGGTVTEIDDYNGTGETWRTHTFLATETFEIASSPKPYSYLLVGRGGDPGTFPANSGGVGGGGGGGGFLNKTDQVIPAGSHEVVIANPVSFNGDSAATGDRGQGESNGSNGGSSGIPTRHSGGGPYIPWEGGGGGGSGGNGSNGAGNGSPPGGAGLVSNITGSNTAYGAGGGGQIQSWNSAIAGKGFSGQNAGIVVAYQIGVSSTTQIKNAQAKQAARSQGHDDGYAEGFSEGYVDFEMPTYADEDTE